MAQESNMESQLPLGMSYSTAYSLGVDVAATPAFTASTVQDTTDYSKDSDQEDSEGRRRGGSFERDLRGERESRRYAPYSTGARGKGRVSSSALKELRIYVSNIPYTTRWQELKDYMKKVGEVSFVEIFEDEKGRSKGCGVVEFMTKEDAEKAIEEYNNKDFQGRPLQIREDRVEEDSRMHRSKLRGNTISQSPGTNPMNALLGLGGGGGMKSNDASSCTVFVSNLDFKINWQKLKDIFRCAGSVVRANVKEDENQKSKGYGTVQFETPIEALNAVNMLNGKTLMERKIVVRMDRNASPAVAAGGAQNQALASNPLAAGAAGNPMALLNILQSLQSLTTLAQLGGFGGNLGALGGNLGALGGNLGALGGNLGGGLGGSLGGSNLGGNMGSSLGSSAATSQAMGSMGSSAAGMGSTAASMGSMGAMGLDASNLAALTSLGGMMNQLGGATNTTPSMGYNLTNYGPTENTSGKQVFVRNLPWKFTWQDLKDKFRAAGKVTRADLLTETDGRSKGCGIVVFETPEEAQRSISMFSGMTFDGRQIDVRLDRFG